MKKYKIRRPYEYQTDRHWFEEIANQECNVANELAEANRLKRLDLMLKDDDNFIDSSELEDGA
ncbi:MAG: hypothetical protein GWN01_01475 [Nitrosopumilaceae archaeon]|nr:hypothetical protein [Nitrosopumilaceae archaeon]NIU86029.1 hypothetical protein [Nitrosopumilaceae archaeon]NIX60248.1 hypothetical protein [Nitrosopumilaceae archaeon]